MSEKANDPYAALRIPHFRYLLTIRFFAILAIMMQAVAVSWQVYAITNDPLSLGLVGLAEALPALTIALFAGHVVDHHNRKNILRISIGMFLLMAAMLCVLSIVPHSLGTAPFYVAVVVCGLARAFLGPTMFALTGTWCRRSCTATPPPGAPPSGRRAPSWGRW